MARSYFIVKVTAFRNWPIKSFSMIVFLIFMTHFCFAQTLRITHISGKVIGKLPALDTINLDGYPINKKYYSDSIVTAIVRDNNFKLNLKLSFPQMMCFNLQSLNGISFSSESNFIDRTTTKIFGKYENDYYSFTVNGTTSKEYIETFIPFISKCKPLSTQADTQFAKLKYNKGQKFDTLLNFYIWKHPNSYVALWHLIFRFASFGQSNLREKMAQNFSPALIKLKIWVFLNEDLKNSLIKEGEKFPILTLTDTVLNPKPLSLIGRRFILVDFWFSRCRPCLDAIPRLKKILEKYTNNGLTYVSISTDKTTNIDIWKKRINLYDLSWPQYLDENGIQSKKMGINKFPTLFLLDANSKIVGKDLTLDELDEYLNLHLANPDKLFDTPVFLGF